MIFRFGQTQIFLAKYLDKNDMQLILQQGLALVVAINLQAQQNRFHV